MGMIVSKIDFAKILGKSPRWITTLIEEGLPASGGGRGKSCEIDTADAINWLIKKEVSKQTGDNDESSASEEDRKLKRARREEIELRVEERRGNLAPVHLFEEIAFRIASVYASQLDGLSSRMAAELAGIDEPAEIRNLLHAETRQIRKSTAEQLMVEIQRLSDAANKIYATADSGDSEFPADKDAE